MKRRCTGCLKQFDRPISGGISQCSECRATSMAKRDATPLRKAYKAQRYNYAHQSLRRQWLPLVESGVVPCARCGDVIQGAWHLDHLEDGSSRPSHPHCNTVAGNQNRPPSPVT